MLALFQTGRRGFLFLCSLPNPPHGFLLNGPRLRLSRFKLPNICANVPFQGGASSTSDLRETRLLLPGLNFSEMPGELFLAAERHPSPVTACHAMAGSCLCDLAQPKSPVTGSACTSSRG